MQIHEILKAGNRNKVKIRESIELIERIANPLTIQKLKTEFEYFNKETEF